LPAVLRYGFVSIFKAQNSGLCLDWHSSFLILRQFHNCCVQQWVEQAFMPAVLLLKEIGFSH
jgi:hypothetical protein